MFEKMESSEGGFDVDPLCRSTLNYYNSCLKFMKNNPSVSIDTSYDCRGMSDFLKVPVGMLASDKVQHIFFENGFTGFQFVPVDVDNGEIHRGYSFINVLAHYDLLDPISSEAEEFSQALGGFTDVLEEVIDMEKFRLADIQHDCFTLSTYRDPYYVSEKVKVALEDAGIIGIEFIPMEFSAIKN